VAGQAREAGYVLPGRAAGVEHDEREVGACRGLAGPDARPTRQVLDDVGGRLVLVALLNTQRRQFLAAVRNRDAHQPGRVPPRGLDPAREHRYNPAVRVAERDRALVAQLDGRSLRVGGERQLRHVHGGRERQVHRNARHRAQPRVLSARATQPHGSRSRRQKTAIASAAGRPERDLEQRPAHRRRR
jgi:hypothetical protein